MSKYFHLQASFACFVNNCTKKYLFGFKSELLLVHSLLMKSKKRLAGNVFDTFAAHSSVVHDITHGCSTGLKSDALAAHWLSYF